MVIDYKLSEAEKREHAEDLIVSRQREIGEIRTLCLLLGPYRNLTTFIASTLSFHPHCQVLNHGGCRIFGDSTIDFIHTPSRDTLDRFVKYAIQISGGGRRGVYGGSIFHSHAFDDASLSSALRAQGIPPIKAQVKSLVWKESLRVATYIRQRGIAPAGILEMDPRLRFILPVRHPIDCALSNIRTGHASLFTDVKDPGELEPVLEAVVRELAWGCQIALASPQKCFVFFEHEYSPATLGAIAEFLLLEPAMPWAKMAEKLFTIRKGGEHSEGLKQMCRRLVGRYFSFDPKFRNRMMTLLARE